MQVQPYLFFEGRCEEALAFYGRTLGAQIDMLMRFRGSPEPPPPDAVPMGCDDKVMHASFRIGETVLMCPTAPVPASRGFRGSRSRSVSEVAEAERLFAALGDGGEVQMPLGETFWSPAFGMVQDRFGVSWKINTAA